jgi:hypothetical protein
LWFMLLWVVVALWLGWMGRVLCVDCVCATEPPCSSDNSAGAAGAAALAVALETNTTLLTFYFRGEFVVL